MRHAAAGASHAKPGIGHWSHVAKETATPRPRLRYTCVFICIDFITLPYHLIGHRRKVKLPIILT